MADKYKYNSYGKKEDMKKLKQWLEIQKMPVNKAKKNYKESDDESDE